MSTVSSNLYPPIIPDALPAFVGGTGAECKIYFSLSKYNSYSNIKYIQISMINQKTNASILNSPSGIIVTSSISIDKSLQNSDYKYYITVNSNQILNQSFKTGQYYKIQLRFVSTKADDTAEQVTAEWLEKNKDYFSEWSKTCLVKSISEPKLVLKYFEEIGNNNQEIILTSQLVEIIGSLENLDTNEYLKSYNVKLYELNNENNLLINSGDIFTNEYKPNEFNYQLSERLLEGVSYKLIFSYTTNNNYSKTYEYIFRTIQRGLQELNGVILATPDNKNGRIIVSLTLNDTGKYLRNVTIRRTSSKTNFHKWEDIANVPFTNNTNNFIWEDRTPQSGVFYKYCAQQRNSNGDRGIIRDWNVTSPVMVVFQDIFLITEDAQLKIQFNPVISDFKYNVSESQQVTIGAKYPYVKRNSNNYFRSFSIGGLITSLIDTDYYNSYFEKNSNFYTYHSNDAHSNLTTNNNLINFTSKKQIYQDSELNHQSYNQKNNISEYNDYIYEKEFRQKVYDFLYAHNVKLFKSTTEGNILIKLMNISFQPVETLGRMLYSFTATAVQIDEATIANYNKYNILKTGDYSKNVVNTIKYLGQLQGTYSSNRDIVQTILKEKYANKAKYGYINIIDFLTYLKLEITSPPYLIIDKGGSLEKFSGSANETSTKIKSGYIVSINDIEIIIPAFQVMMKETKTINKKKVTTTVPKRIGYFELNDEDITVTSLKFKYPVQCTIDYVASITEKEDTSKIPSKTAYYYNPGQLYGSFEPQELLINRINKKYFLNTKTNFQKLLSINGIRLEGPIGAVAYVKDSKDSEYTRHVLSNGYLQLMEEDVFINELYFQGIHLTTEVNKDWYTKSNTFPSLPFDKSDQNVYIDFPKNPKTNTVYKIRRTQKVKAVLYNEWFDTDNITLKMTNADSKKSYQLIPKKQYSLFVDPTPVIIDDENSPVEMIYIYGSWYSLAYYENNKEKFTQLSNDDIRHLRENEYLIMGEKDSLNQIKNPRNHEVYIIQDYKWIRHNDQWYPFSDNNDIICPVDGIVDYFYELAKGEYNNEI